MDEEYLKRLDAAGMQFGAVCKVGRNEPVLFTTEGQIYAGSLEENRRLWGKLLIQLVPLGTKEQIAAWHKPVKYIDTLGLNLGVEK